MTTPDYIRRCLKNGKNNIPPPGLRDSRSSAIIGGSRLYFSCPKEEHNMKKTLLSLLLALVLALTACGGNSGTPSDSSAPAAGGSTQES